MKSKTSGVLLWCCLMLMQTSCDVARLNRTSNPPDLLPGGEGTPIDPDLDDIYFPVDNCQNTANPDQKDLDGDQMGDACDNDRDGDGKIDNGDNCPDLANADQLNLDSDAFGDACDVDHDGDGVVDTADKCPHISNADQTDTDGDGVGDECDLDDDGDGVQDGQDAFPRNARESVDTDRDGIGDNADLCRTMADPTNRDSDNDGVGDVCDLCPAVANPNQADGDGDRIGDACDLCPSVANPRQEDLDNDHIGDACDNDADGDGFRVGGNPADCNDRNASIKPGAPEIFDFVDSNCDGVKDRNINLSMAPVIILGEASYDLFGSTVAPAGDVNRDGLADFLINAPFSESAGKESNGKTYLIYGSRSLGNFLLAENATAVFLGEASQDQMGEVIAPAGDVNGDGFADILIASPEKNQSQGRVYLIYGFANPLNQQVDLASVGSGIDGAVFDGEFPGDLFGMQVSGIGDINGDRCSDILIASSGYSDGRDTAAGKVYLFYGKGSCNNQSPLRGKIPTRNLADASFIGENSFDYLGSALSNSGDVNGDGFADVVIGAQGFDQAGGIADTGKVYVFFGGHTRLAGNMDVISRSNATILGDGAFDQLGAQLQLGDVSADGKLDLVFGAYLFDENGTDSGNIFVVPGASTLSFGSIGSLSTYRLRGQNNFDYTGYSLSAAGDLNGDGFDDILIGAYNSAQNGTGAGKVYLQLSTVPTASQNLEAGSTSTFFGESQQDQAGYSVSIIGDANGDHLDDFIIGAPRNAARGPSSGKVYLFYGKDAPR